jgi:hypothetical protein
MSKYLPVSQKDVADGSQDLEEGRKSSSSNYDVREKHFPLFDQTSKSSTWARWIPWILCLSLLVSNVYAWVKFDRPVFDDVVYCKWSSPISYYHLLTTQLDAAPANVALQYKNVRWEAAIQDDMTEFQGVPNVKNNKLWDDLFNARKYLLRPRS